MDSQQYSLAKSEEYLNLKKDKPTTKTITLNVQLTGNKKDNKEDDNKSKKPSSNKNKRQKSKLSKKDIINDNVIDSSDTDDQPIEMYENESDLQKDINDKNSDIEEVSAKSVLLAGFDEVVEELKDSQEPILQDCNFRLAIKPIDPEYEILWKLYKKQKEAFWTPEEIDFSEDRHDFKKLSFDIQFFIKRILAFFAGADSIVNINIKKRFSKITVKEVDVTHAFQQMIENIHGEVYADMLINIVIDDDERAELINAFKNIPSIKKMIDWATNWIESKCSIGYIIIVFCIFEGVMFSGAFAAIYWLKKILGADKMRGLFQSNNLIAKDEGMHTNFGCVLYSYIINRVPEKEVHIMINEAVEICKEFNSDGIRVDLIGMNTTIQNNYIEYVSDRLLGYLKYNKLYNTQLPDQFQFMNSIGILNKENFFDRRASEYQKAHNTDNRDWAFKILSDY